MDDFDFVDVEGDMEGDGSRSANSKKKDVLEEGRAHFTSSFSIASVIFIVRKTFN